MWGLGGAQRIPWGAPSRVGAQQRGGQGTLGCSRLGFGVPEPGGLPRLGAQSRGAEVAARCPALLGGGSAVGCSPPKPPGALRELERGCCVSSEHHLGMGASLAPCISRSSSGCRDTPEGSESGPSGHGPATCLSLQLSPLQAGWLQMLNISHFFSPTFPFLSPLV